MHNFSQIPDLTQIDNFLAKHHFELQYQWRKCFRLAAGLARSPFFLQVVYESDEDLVWATKVGLLSAQRTDVNISERIRNYDNNHSEIREHRVGYTILGYICSKQELLQVARALLSRHSVLGHINVKSKDGEAPLYIAINRCHTEVVNLLIEKGADIHVKNNYDYTPLLWAEWNVHTEVVKLLEKRARKLENKFLEFIKLHFEKKIFFFNVYSHFLSLLIQKYKNAHCCLLFYICQHFYFLKIFNSP